MFSDIAGHEGGEDGECEHREHNVEEVVREIQVQLVQYDMAGFASQHEHDDDNRRARRVIRWQLDSGSGSAGHRRLCLAVRALRGEPGE